MFSCLFWKHREPSDSSVDKAFGLRVQGRPSKLNKRQCTAVAGRSCPCAGRASSPSQASQATCTCSQSCKSGILLLNSSLVVQAQYEGSSFASPAHDRQDSLIPVEGSSSTISSSRPSSYAVALGGGLALLGPSSAPGSLAVRARSQTRLAQSSPHESGEGGHPYFPHQRQLSVSAAGVSGQDHLLSGSVSGKRGSVQAAAAAAVAMLHSAVSLTQSQQQLQPQACLEVASARTQFLDDPHSSIDTISISGSEGDVEDEQQTNNRLETDEREAGPSSAKSTMPVSQRTLFAQRQGSVSLAHEAAFIKEWLAALKQATLAACDGPSVEDSTLPGLPRIRRSLYQGGAHATAVDSPSSGRGGHYGTNLVATYGTPAERSGFLSSFTTSMSENAGTEGPERIVEKLQDIFHASQTAGAQALVHGAAARSEPVTAAVAGTQSAAAVAAAAASLGASQRSFVQQLVKDKWSPFAAAALGQPPRERRSSARTPSSEYFDLSSEGHSRPSPGNRPISNSRFAPPAAPVLHSEGSFVEGELASADRAPYRNLAASSSELALQTHRSAASFSTAELTSPGHDPAWDRERWYMDERASNPVISRQSLPAAQSGPETAHDHAALLAGKFLKGPRAAPHPSNSPIPSPFGATPGLLANAPLDTKPGGPTARSAGLAGSSFSPAVLPTSGRNFSAMSKEQQDLLRRLVTTRWSPFAPTCTPLTAVPEQSTLPLAEPTLALQHPQDPGRAADAS